jgi:iron complex outermembrane recepter protein
MTRFQVLKSVLFGSVGMMALVSAAAAQARDINIPAEDLRFALDSYIRQSGVQLVYTVRDVNGVRSNAVDGRYEPIAALDKMLAGTELAANRDASGAVIVSKRLSAGPDVSPAGSSGPVEQVVVTGSRVITNSVNSPTPLTVVSTQQLQAITPSNVPDALNKLPVFAISNGQRTTGNPSGNATGNFLNLRGFGSQRTLILLDGNRVPATSVNGTVDINTLPQMLMSRVDIVTGGASAVYGSDAVTGVVNFILDKRFNGWKTVAQGGVSGRGDDASYKIGLAGGTDFLGGRGHVEFSFEHYNSDGISDMNKRPLGPLVYTESGAGSTANPFHLAINSRLAGYTPGGYVTSANPALNDHFFQNNGVLAPFTHGLPTGSAGDESGGDGGYAGQGFPNAGANPWLLASLRTDQLFGRLDYDLTDTIHTYVQASAAEAYNFNSFFTQWFAANVLSGNPYLPASVQAVMAPGETFNISKTIQDAPGYSARALTTNLDATVGLNGTVWDQRFNWDLHYTHGESRLHEANPWNINQQRLTAALDSVRNGAGQIVCRVSTTASASSYPGCIPYNPFGPNAETAGAVKYIDDYTDFVETNKMDDVAGGVSGNLFDAWAGPVRGALSAEYRHLSLTNASNFSPTRKVDCSTLNPATCNPGAQYWTSNIVGPMAASEGVWETAGEVDVPLLHGIPMFQSLDFNAAGRYTEYSASGSATTWKAGLVWAINDDITLRGTASRDIRAPTLFDLFSPTSSGLSGFSDILTQTGGNVQAISQGNANLKPEVARTNTLGGVYHPSWLSGLTLSLDWYMINIANAITSVDGRNATIQNQCIASGGSSPYCTLYIRPFPITNTTPANYPSAVLSQSLNVAKTSTHGVDGEADYNFSLGDVSGDLDGDVTSRLLVSYQPVLQAQTLPGAVITNAAGAVPLAATRITFDLGYTSGPFGVNFEERYHSSERQSSNSQLVYTDPLVPEIFYSDLTLSYRFKLHERNPDEQWEAFLSVQNLFDQQPHTWISTGLTGSQGFAYPTPTDEDVVGRYFTMGVRVRM